MTKHTIEYTVGDDETRRACFSTDCDATVESAGDRYCEACEDDGTADRERQNEHDEAVGDERRDEQRERDAYEDSQIDDRENGEHYDD